VDTPAASQPYFCHLRVTSVFNSLIIDISKLVCIACNLDIDAGLEACFAVVSSTQSTRKNLLASSSI
jgi:hypothetical protein